MLIITVATQAAAQTTPLSTPEALNQAPLPLPPLQLPAAISWWPLAPGWWLLMALAITVIGVAVWWLYRRYHNNRDKRAARHALTNVLAQWQADHDDAQLLQQLNTILKRLCRHRAPHALSLSGEAWVAFLNQNKPLFTDHNARALSDYVYCAPQQIGHVEAASLVKQCQRWVSTLTSSQPATVAKSAGALIEEAR